MKVRMFSLEEHFDPIKSAQDRVAFRSWATDLRNDPDEFVRTSDAALVELAFWTLQRALSRSLPEGEGFKWTLVADSVGVSLHVVTPSGVEKRFSDPTMGILVHLLEHTDWKEVESPAPPPVPFAPFRFAEVDQDDPFERARAEVLARRLAAQGGAA